MDRNQFRSKCYYVPEHQTVQLPQAASEQDKDEKHVDTSKSSVPPKTDTTRRKREVSEKGEKLKKDLDKIIDEIDDVLEENAEEFIRSYVQRGGE